MPLYNPEILFKKNALINGSFTVSQRGNSFPLNTVGYTADRWQVILDSGGGTLATGSVNRAEFTTGDSLGGLTTGRNTNCLLITNSSVGTNLGVDSYWILRQAIEDVRTFSDEIVTLSFYTFSSILNKKIAVELVQVFDSASPDVSIVPINSSFVTTPNSAWNYHTFTFKVPTVAGKTIGANSVLSMLFWFQGGANLSSRHLQIGGLPWGGVGNVYLARVQLEKGLATEVEQRSFNEEYLLCQRYFQMASISLRQNVPSANCVLGSAFGINRMRTFPTVSLATIGSRSLLASVAVYPSSFFTSIRIEAVSSGAGDAYVLDERYSLSAEL